MRCRGGILASPAVLCAGRDGQRQLARHQDALAERDPPNRVVPTGDHDREDVVTDPEVARSAEVATAGTVGAQGADAELRATDDVAVDNGQVEHDHVVGGTRCQAVDRRRDVERPERVVAGDLRRLDVDAAVLARELLRRVDAGGRELRITVEGRGAGRGGRGRRDENCGNHAQQGENDKALHQKPPCPCGRSS